MSRVELIKSCFNEFTGENTQVLKRLYDDNVHFQDPITEAHGFEDVAKYYAHAYSRIRQINFHFHKMHEAGDTVVAEWNMNLAVSGLNGGKPFVVRGVSVLTFNTNSGKIIRHRDYLDVGEMVYENVPLIGGLIRMLKGKLH